MNNNETAQVNHTCYGRVVNQTETWGNMPAYHTPLPILFYQIALVLGSNLLFLPLFRHSHQPRIVRDLVSALLVSPFTLEVITPKLSEKVWPAKGNTNLKVLADMGLLYAAFIKGLQMDLTPLKNRKGIKTLFLSFGMVLIPFCVGCSLYNLYYYKNELTNNSEGKALFVYWGAVLASSSFPTLASILSKTKLLSTDIGRESLCIGMINDLVSWVLMVVVIALSCLPYNVHLDNRSWNPVTSVVLYTITFGLLCPYAIRPLIQKFLIKKHNEAESYEDSTIHFMLFMVIISGLLSEFFGGHLLLGAFIFGLAVPHGFFSETLVEKMDDCVSGLLMPLFYASIGIRMRSKFIIRGYRNTSIILLALFLKPLGVFIFSVLSNVPRRDGLALSVLQNTKGLLSIAIAFIGYERGHLTDEALTVMILIVLLSTATVGPIMCLFKRMMKNTQPYEHRSIGGLRPYDDFRVVSCIQETHNLPGMINLLEISNNSERSPMSVFGVHLMELVGRASAMFIVHQAGNESSNGSPNSFFSKKSAQTNQIVSAFEGFRKKHNATTTVQTLSIVSPMETMHEDIINISKDMQASVILLPYHKHQGMDGKLEDGSNIEFRVVNENVMRHAPCSVGLLVDRGNRMLPAGIESNLRRSGSQDGVVRVGMIYFGGPDDREALSFAWRLGSNPLVNFTLIRFVVGDSPVDIQPMIESAESKLHVHPVHTESKMEKMLDEDFINRFLRRCQGEGEIDYKQITSNNGEETVARLREMQHKKFDLYVVGRGYGVFSPMTAGLAEWSENQDLGTIGDVLVNSDFSGDVSTLIVQQYPKARRRRGGRRKGGEVSPLEPATVIQFS